MSTPRRSWIGPYVGITLSWGCSFLFIKLALDSFTPFGVIFLSCSIGTLIMLVIGRIKGVGLPHDPRVWLHLGVVAISISALPGILAAVAESHTSSLFAGIILSGMTPLTSLFFIAIVFRDEPISRPQVLGLGIGLVGVLTVFGIWRGLGANPWWAIMALVVAATSVGFSYPYSRRHLTHRDLHPISLAGGQLVFASIILLPMFLIDGRSGGGVTARALVGIVGLGAFANGLSYMWNFRVIAVAGSSVASTVSYLTPMISVLSGVTILHEKLAWYEPLGGVIVILGIAISQGRLRLTSPKRDPIHR
jgi:drug/metabolite transporter (DMT)-like permease